LRERKEDIPLLIEHIIKGNMVFKNKKLSNKALKVLSEYKWPGNVRELQNVIHRALLLSRDNIIEPPDLHADLTSDAKFSGKRLEDVEREYILKVFKDVDGQKGMAAEILGIDPKTLYRKLSSYGVE
jgi:DNA-binding NtrC family response regulator